MKSSELHRKVKRNGWQHIRTDGSHYVYEKGAEHILYPITGQKKLVKD